MYPEWSLIANSHLIISLSKAQYEGAFKRWNWRKNLTAKEWKVVAHKIQKRKARDPELEVQEVGAEIRIHGIMIPSKKVKVETRRHNHQSIFEKFRKGEFHSRTL
jgi:hypothetical protein